MKIGAATITVYVIWTLSRSASRTSQGFDTSKCQDLVGYCSITPLSDFQTQASAPDSEPSEQVWAPVLKTANEPQPRNRDGRSDRFLDEPLCPLNARQVTADPLQLSARSAP
ncbi:hypothetical protein B0H19DRAFT_1187812 [Mycena capillaripes]|nr:hypothetical protein B0H19DRAFT_1187651 [Mycena capillaripes]KAJ6532543.1 hypothetical protein B0H19DRAFT_1187812 [Mycena capillaripes]